MKDEAKEPTMIEVTGASDDLIEVDGDVNAEFYLLGVGDDMNYLAFSDGTLLSVVYDKSGMWRINRLVAGSAAYRKTAGD